MGIRATFPAQRRTRLQKELQMSRIPKRRKRPVYSQLRVIRKQENRRPPSFLRNFLDSRVSPLSFLSD